MSFTTDPTTTLGKMRLLTTDTDPSRPIMDDADLTAFLGMAGHYMPAAAMALDSIAANETLSLKSMNIMGMSTDGPAVAKALMKRAQQLRDDYKNYCSTELGFATAEMPSGVFSLEELIRRNYGVAII